MSRTGSALRTRSIRSLILLGIVVMSLAALSGALASTTKAANGGYIQAFCLEPEGQIISRTTVYGPLGQWVSVMTRALNLETGKYHYSPVASAKRIAHVASSSGGAVVLQYAQFDQSLKPGDSQFLVEVNIARYSGSWSWGGWQRADVYYQFHFGAYQPWASGMALCVG